MLREIKIGDRIILFGKLYRILIKHRGLILMIEMNVDKMIFKWEHETVLSAFLNRDEAVIDTSEEARYPIEHLTDDEKASIRMMRDYIEDMLDKLYPNWDDLAKKRTKPELLKLIDQFICTPKYVRKKVREYLQSGRNEYSLMDRRKMIDHSGCSMVKLRGAKPKYYDPNRIENDEKLKSIYDEYFAQFLNSSEKLTIQAVYDEMVAEHFENTALAPPTYRRFNYYVNRRLEENNMTLKQAKMNARERRNNHRLLKGNAQSGVYYPGQMLEIDAVELDNYNVSLRNRSQLVGKGVMYCAVDVYSCCLVACWIGFENNSITGITDLLYTLLDDHTEEAARYGVELTPELFPSRFIPTSIRTDHGAEYESKEFSRMCKEMGINHHFVAPATGSLKGTVEQFFHQFQTLMKSQLVDAGETYRRYNSNHKQKAVLTIEESRSMMYQFVKYFNRQIRPNYPYTREMIESGIAQCPMAIWEYGIRNIQSPRQVTDENRDMLYFALLRNDIPFRASGKGISYKGLYYWDESSWFLELSMKMNREEKKSIKISGIRYDPRLVDRIYRMENGRLITIPLSFLRDEQKSFLGMSWKEYLELYEMKKENEAAYRPINDQYRREAKKETRKIVDAAKAVKALGSPESKGKNKTTEIRAARKEDGRELVRRDADAKGKLLLPETEIPEPAAAEISQDAPMQPASMEEFLKMTEELSKFN